MTFRTPGLFERVQGIRKVQEQAIRASRTYAPLMTMSLALPPAGPPIVGSGMKSLSPLPVDKVELVEVMCIPSPEPIALHIETKGTAEVVLKGESPFNAQCLEASKLCARMCRRYSWLVTLMQFLSGAMAAVCGFVAVHELWWGIGIGVGSSIVAILARVLGWSKLEEKYASLSHSFIRLIHNPGPDFTTRFAEYKMFMESSVLEADLL